MKKILVALLGSWCSCASAQTAQELIDNGKNSEKFKTGSGINSSPITYAHQGRQYMTVLSGTGGVLNRVMKVADGVPTGTFALRPE